MKTRQRKLVVKSIRLEGIYQRKYTFHLLKYNITKKEATNKNIHLKIYSPKFTFGCELWMKISEL